MALNMLSAVAEAAWFRVVDIYRHAHVLCPSLQIGSVLLEWCGGTQTVHRVHKMIGLI